MTKRRGARSCSDEPAQLPRISLDVSWPEEKPVAGGLGARAPLTSEVIGPRRVPVISLSAVVRVSFIGYRVGRALHASEAGGAHGYATINMIISRRGVCSLARPQCSFPVCSSSPLCACRDVSTPGRRSPKENSLSAISGRGENIRGENRVQLLIP